MSANFHSIVREADITTVAIRVSQRSGHDLTPFNITMNGPSLGSGFAIAYCRQCNAVALINECDDGVPEYYGTAFDTDCGRALAISDLNNPEVIYPHVLIAMELAPRDEMLAR